MSAIRIWPRVELDAVLDAAQGQVVIASLPDGIFPRLHQFRAALYRRAQRRGMAIAIALRGNELEVSKKECN